MVCFRGDFPFTASHQAFNSATDPFHQPRGCLILLFYWGGGEGRNKKKKKKTRALGVALRPEASLHARPRPQRCALANFSHQAAGFGAASVKTRRKPRERLPCQPFWPRSFPSSPILCCPCPPQLFWPLLTPSQESHVAVFVFPQKWLVDVNPLKMMSTKGAP